MDVGGKHNSQSGVTLIEVIIGIAIAGILVGLALMPSTPMTQMTLNQNLAVIRDTLQQARNVAHMKQECVAISRSGNSLNLTAYTDCGPPLNNKDPNPGFNATVSFSNDVTLGDFTRPGQIAAGPPIIIDPFIFWPTGGTNYSPPSDVTFSVTSGKVTKTFTITYTLGQIEQSP